MSATSRIRVVLGLFVCVSFAAVVSQAAQAAPKVLYRDGTLTAHNGGYPVAGLPPQARLSSVVVHDDVFKDRTSFKVTLAGPPPSSEQAYRLTVGLGNYNPNGECVLGPASATAITWLEQPANSSYFGYAFSRAGNVITAQIVQGTVSTFKPVDEGYRCGGAVLDNHADDGTPYNFDTLVASTDRILGRVTASKLAFKSKKLNARAGKVKIKVGCESATACRGRLAVTFGKAALAKATYAIARGKSKTITLKLTTKAKRLLARHRSVKVAVTSTPTGGEKSTKKLVLTR